MRRKDGPRKFTRDRARQKRRTTEAGNLGLPPHHSVQAARLSRKPITG